MPWWLDLLLLLLAAGLWGSGCENRDDVWGLLQKSLGALAVAVVLLGGRQIWLELIVLAVALWLPGANSARLASRRQNGDG
jgi:hypothetical protein